MSTSITRSGNTQRIRLVAAEEAKATGKTDAQQLLANIANTDDGCTAAEALYVSLVEFIALAHDNRFEECNARLNGFCEVVGPVLHRTATLEAKYTQLSASLNQADLELAVRDLELQFITETEGGEL